MNDNIFDSPFACVPAEKFLVLERFVNSRYGTFGRLLWSDNFLMYTLEPSNLDGERNHAILEGSYSFDLDYSPKFGDMMYYIKVPHRFGIMFHAGNKAFHTKGCILVGKRYDKYSIMDSRSALADLREFLDGNINVRYIHIYHSWVEESKSLFNYD